MALATRCPQCHTAFRVASDQLKLRSGLVRCGTCREIFNGIENLLHPDEDLPAEIAASEPNTTTDSASSTVSSAPSGSASSTAAHTGADAAPSSETIAPVPVEMSAMPSSLLNSPDSKNSSELSVGGGSPMSSAAASAVPIPPIRLLRAASADNADSTSSKDSGSIQAGSTLPLASKSGKKTTFKRSTKTALEPLLTAFRKPARTAARQARAEKPTVAISPPVEEPDFIQRELLQQKKRRLGRPPFLILCGLLLAMLVLQLALATRTSVAAYFPKTRPILEKFCHALGCKVGLPMQIESVSIESSELQPVENHPGKFALNVLLRNRSKTVQAWPAIELSLQDADDRTVGRRVIVASEFMPAGSVLSNGFGANMEQAIRLNFDLTQLKASGYRVYLFYP